MDKPKCVKAQAFLDWSELPTTIEESGDVAKVWWLYVDKIGKENFKFFVCVPVYEVWGAKKRKKYIEKEIAREKNNARKKYLESLVPSKPKVDKKYTRRPDIVEMLVLDHEGNPTKCVQYDAWCYLELNAGIIKDENGRAEWKDPTPTGKRSIAIGLTKVGDEKYDGSISLEGKRLAVFRFGTFDSA